MLPFSGGQLNRRKAKSHFPDRECVGKATLIRAFFDRDFFPCHNAPQFGLTTSGWKLRKRKGGADWRRTMPDVARACHCKFLLWSPALILHATFIKNARQCSSTPMAAVSSCHNC